MSATTLTRLATPLDANWRLRGLCLALDPDFMYPDDRDHSGQAAAKNVCGGCDVVKQCLKNAIDTDDWHGIRGGMTPKERRAHAAGDQGKPCDRCKTKFTPRIARQRFCPDCARANDGQHYSAERRECRACGSTAYVKDDGQLGKHRLPGKGCARPFCRGEVTETEQRADYLHQISQCVHNPEWRQPGGLCGGCGKDDFFAEMGEAA
ncbi:WhiB family transcriptional regulator [Micromonospora sp. NBC_00362]|uniref:WhiB family transcriptional regulator n=1 Tax=Micromonospora sp. NBC_00362 TaxID=2975975 RepID=UPI002253AD47|nr:WhiB family transcriptional regulator [Micromonospora sp. NBC_00362]MCX5119238.1 WhiB family transcriptional regulator [Micromonospora sp. NBC_00362]